ncbi:MAG: dihydropteroate synthase [Candidatus Omnitrophota bacterium]|nr:dihydropteroate synthase [Candidatus Omnitrophota bacterium]
MRIFRFSCQDEVRKIMRDIGVDAYGIKIMLPKAQSFLIRLNAISNIAANIIKQEMLSLGADVAISRGALTGKTKKTDCLIIGRLDQLKTLARKLELQPFGLRKVASELNENIKNYSRNDFNLALGKYSLRLGKKTHIMAVINATADSFSGDGLYRVKCSDYLKLALGKAEKMIKEGADIIDIGGQSSRPGAKSVSTKEEILRTLPIVKFLAKKINVPISIDTTRSEVAKAALDAGAQMINDISGLKDKRLARVAAKSNAAVVLMHMLGEPANMQKIIAYQSLIDDIISYLKQAIERAEANGIKPEKIVIDPGIGFGKKPEHNFQIIRRLADFKVLGKPILLGPSRKSFIGKILKVNPRDRIFGTMATCVMAAERGAHILRVHDVKEVNQALSLAAAVNSVKNA